MRNDCVVVDREYYAILSIFYLVLNDVGLSGFEGCCALVDNEY